MTLNEHENLCLLIRRCDAPAPIPAVEPPGLAAAQDSTSRCRWIADLEELARRHEVAALIEVKPLQCLRGHVRRPRQPSNRATVVDIRRSAGMARRGCCPNLVGDTTQTITLIVAV